jgi:hypothetical protein
MAWLLPWEETGIAAFGSKAFIRKSRKYPIRGGSLQTALKEKFELALTLRRRGVLRYDLGTGA